MIDRIKNIGFLGLVLCSVFVANADIGQTHSLKNQRSQVLNKIDLLREDTSNTCGVIDSLRIEVLRLDEQIFASYEETVDRMAAQKIRHEANDKSVVFLALGISLIAIFLVVLLMALRSRVKENDNVGLRQFYKELTVEFAGKVSADKTQSNQMLRVNIVVVAGLIIMSVSIFAYLLKSL